MGLGETEASLVPHPRRANMQGLGQPGHVVMAQPGYRFGQKLQPLLGGGGWVWLQSR